MRPTRRSVLGGLTAAALAGPIRAETAADPIVDLPKTNQIGFRPSAAKNFVWTVDGPQAAPAAFTILRHDGGEVFHGLLNGVPIDQRASAGEFVRVGDFSVLTAPGTYRIAVNGKLSHPFGIGDGLLQPLFRDAVRAFHLIRANTAINDPVTGVHHAAGHLGDAAMEVNGETRDLSGGWYNAGDFGKWVHMAALSVSHMMWLVELRPQIAAIALDVPATPGLPDILAEARWGLDWMAKMQNADGSVLHKVDAEPALPWGVLPADDKTPRHAKPAGSWDAAVFAAAMAQASRVFTPYDPAYAARCRKAAIAAWRWLEANPDVPNHDPYYAISDIAAKRLWALGEMARLDAALLDEAAAEFAAHEVVPSSWITPQILGAFTLAHGATGKARDVAMRKIAAAADAVITASQTDAYGCNGRGAVYFWGSVENALNAANACFMAHALGAGPRYRAGGARVLDYVLGHNALGRAFVTGHGTLRVEHPWHWIYRDEGIAIPGWAVGGPNRYVKGADEPLKQVIARGTPPAKCYLDLCAAGSWASNEGQTSENAALAFATGMA